MKEKNYSACALFTLLEKEHSQPPRFLVPPRRPFSLAVHMWPEERRSAFFAVAREPAPSGSVAMGRWFSPSDDIVRGSRGAAASRSRFVPGHDGNVRAAAAGRSPRPDHRRPWSPGGWSTGDAYTRATRLDHRKSVQDDVVADSLLPEPMEDSDTVPADVVGRSTFASACGGFRSERDTAAALSWRRTHRPKQVLDAPGLAGHFYCQPVAWGMDNLAIVLDARQVLVFPCGIRPPSSARGIGSKWWSALHVERDEDDDSAQRDVAVTGIVGDEALNGSPAVGSGPRPAAPPSWFASFNAADLPVVDPRESSLTGTDEESSPQPRHPSSTTTLSAAPPAELTGLTFVGHMPNEWLAVGDTDGRVHLMQCLPTDASLRHVRSWTTSSSTSGGGGVVGNGAPRQTPPPPCSWMPSAPSPTRRGSQPTGPLLTRLSGASSRPAEEASSNTPPGRVAPGLTFSSHPRDARVHASSAHVTPSDDTCGLPFPDAVTVMATAGPIIAVGTRRGVCALFDTREPNATRPSLTLGKHYSSSRSCGASSSGGGPRRLAHDGGAVLSIAFLTASAGAAVDVVATGGNDDVAHVWSLRMANEPLVSVAHRGAVRAMAWRPPSGSDFGARESSCVSAQLFTGGGSLDGCIRAIDHRTGRVDVLVDTKTQIAQLMFSADGSHMVTTHGYARDADLVSAYVAVAASRAQGQGGARPNDGPNGEIPPVSQVPSNCVAVWRLATPHWSQRATTGPPAALKQVGVLSSHTSRPTHLVRRQGASDTGEFATASGGQGDDTVRIWDLFYPQPQHSAAVVLSSADGHHHGAAGRSFGRRGVAPNADGGGLCSPVGRV